MGGVHVWRGWRAGPGGGMGRHHTWPCNAEGVHLRRGAWLFFRRHPVLCLSPFAPRPRYVEDITDAPHVERELMLIKASDARGVGQGAHRPGCVATRRRRLQLRQRWEMSVWAASSVQPGIWFAASGSTPWPLRAAPHARWVVAGAAGA